MNSATLLGDVISTPGTSLMIAICIGVWLYIMQYNLNYEDVGLSYHKIIIDKHYWRGITASLSHINILHLFFNMSSLWSCRSIEIAFGTIFYLKYSFLLMVASIAIILIFYHILIYRYNKEVYLHSMAVGYSCVVFGWMTVLSQFSSSQYFNLFGFKMPINLAPFGSLIFTSIIVQNASFIGHLSGIIVGYLIALLEFHKISFFENIIALYLLFWTLVIFIASVKVTTNFPLKFIELENEIRSTAYIQNGVIVRLPPNIV